MPNTKIVATVGPACESTEMVRQLIAAGASVFRFNASHGTQAEHLSRLRTVRAEAVAAGRHIAVLLDLQGPKIRLGKFEGGVCQLESGARFSITTRTVLGNARLACTGYKKFADDVEPGSRVLLADGAAVLRALSKTADTVEFEVVSGGMIGNNKGINLPGVQVSAPSLTPKDIEDLEFGLQHGVDLIALSFVRNAADVIDLKQRIAARGCTTPVIAKIEKPEGWTNIQEILDEADGVMVARGDLGVEVDLESVPQIQKSIIRKARSKSKFVITATQMLESMITAASPTRAEVSDVANAIYDGTDAVMLSAETSTGKYPVEAVSYMTRIAMEAEKAIARKGFEPRKPNLPNASTPEVVADAAYHAARHSHAKCIVVFTTSGASARLIARSRPPVGIYAVTPDAAVARRMAVVYSVTPILAEHVDSTDAMLSQMDAILQDRGLLQAGETVVFVAGQPVGRPGTMNLLKLHRVGESR
ncbi:MAG TPA: pyruvate kinase [Solibacterales bacterium]|nr:pyruvate kinase [Bryobacterales bacterium]